MVAFIGGRLGFCWAPNGSLRVKFRSFLPFVACMYQVAAKCYGSRPPSDRGFGIAFTPPDKLFRNTEHLTT